MSSTTRLAIVFTALLAIAPTSSAQGQLVLGEIHGYSLEDSVTGESPDRAIAVYLPPSYAGSPERHYPVLYLLHGIGGTHADWIGSGQRGSGGNTIQDVMDHEIVARRIAEMIIVAADQRTRGGGSFYTNSTATGAWEDFTVVDLVDYADTTYRTLPRASSRGIAGHSMGGYGAIKLGMKYPDVFQVVYGMNSALLGFAADLTVENQAYARAANTTVETLDPRADFYAASIICVAQAFSPNVDKPPFFVDLPFVTREGRLQRADDPYERWEEHMPLYMLPQYEENLRKLRALRFDSGTEDEYTHIPPTNRALSERLNDLGIPHVFEEYNGDHRNRLWGEEGRIGTEVLPFFSRMLDAE